MADITRRRQGELVRGVFQLLLTQQDGLPAKDILRKIEQVVPPNVFEESDYPNRPGVRRYERIIRFSTMPAVKAGWLIKDRGQWILTEEGRRAFEKFTDPEQFLRESMRLYRLWASERPKTDDEAVDDESPQAAATTLEEAEEAAWAEIDNYLAEMNPYDFQELVGGLLRGMDYYITWISPPGPDRGIDIIAHADPLGVTGPRIKVQVKRRADKITVDGIRSFMAVMAEGDVGLFVSTGGFTKEAEDEARRQERRRITLLDLKRLFDLWVEHYERVPEEKRQLLPLRKVHFLAAVE